MDMNLNPSIDKIPVLFPLDICKLMQRILQRENQLGIRYAHCWVVALSKDNKLLNLELVEMDTTIPSVTAEPMQVLRVPLLKDAQGIILVRNHLEDSIEPSEEDEDKDFTDQLIQACRIMKIPVLDHILITPNSYYSFEEAGLLARLEKSLKYVPQYELEQQYRNELEREKTNMLQEIDEKIQQMARQMLSVGLTVETISQVTGLNEVEIEGLKTNPKMDH